MKEAMISIAAASVLLICGCATTGSSNQTLEKIQLGQSPNPTPTSTLENPDGGDSVFDRFAELDMEDQSGDGTQVEIEEVRLSLGNGFLVISTKAGDVLGYEAVARDSQPVVIELATPVSFSQELVGSLFLDNGDGVFSPDSDPAIWESKNELVRESFDYKVLG